MLQSKSNILYVRAALKPLARHIKVAGGVAEFLREHVEFNELLVPHFHGARPFWRERNKHYQRQTNSGPLGKLIAASSGSILSRHPTHAFTGFGMRVEQVLAEHDGSTSCFHPLGVLADRYDFSMLLLGCLDESPGFSTVHVAQHRLGLSQQHLLRFMLRWDLMSEGSLSSRIAPEVPGCSLSFDKFYPYYESDGNLVRGEWHGVSWVFISSARRALNTELALLREHGRFVDCGRMTCLTCRLRSY